MDYFFIVHMFAFGFLDLRILIVFSSQFRPLVKEMSSWPRPNLTASPGSSPFDGPVATRTRARLSSGSPQSPAAVDQRQLSKNANTNATAKTTKRGYCEACGVMYASLSEHLRGSQHKAFAARKGNFDDLDRLIARGKSLAEYVAEVRGSTAFNTTGACGLEYVLTPPYGNVHP